jgi:hypothetical protein
MVEEIIKQGMDKLEGYYLIIFGNLGVTFGVTSWKVFRRSLIGLVLKE